MTGSADLLWSNADRAHRLLLEKQFVCRCRRCCAFDYSRLLVCPRCAYPSCPVGPDLLVVCSRPACAAMLPFALKASLLDGEQKLVTRCTMVEGLLAKCSDPLLMSVDLVGRAQKLVGQAHIVMRESWSMVRDVHENRGEWRLAAQAGQHVVLGTLLLWLEHRVWTDPVLRPLATVCVPTDTSALKASVSSSAPATTSAPATAAAATVSPPVVSSVEADEESPLTTALCHLWAPDANLSWIPCHFDLAVQLERVGDAYVAAALAQTARPFFRAAAHIHGVLHGPIHSFAVELAHLAEGHPRRANSAPPVIGAVRRI